MTQLYRMRPSEIWDFLVTQPASFWWLNIYMFFEYVRPQELFPVINFLPWAQITLIATIAFFLIEGNWLRVGNVINKLLVAFSVIVVASIFTAYYPDESRKFLTLYFNWVLLFFLVVNIITTERRFYVFLLAFVLYNFQMTWGAVKQWSTFGFGFRSWGLTGGAGWFNNSGDFGVALCIFLPISIYFYFATRPYLKEKWKVWFIAALPITAVMSIVGSSSRGAVLGAAGFGLSSVLQTNRRVRTVILLAVAALIVWVALPTQQKQRFSEAGEDHTSVSRLTYWRHGREIAAAHPLHGIGYYNWMTYYDERLGPRVLPHNTFVLAMAELGYPGLIVFVGIIGATFVVNRRTRKLAHRYPMNGRFMFLIARGLDGATLGFVISGFFNTVLYYPFIYVHIAMVVSLHEVVRRGVASARVEARRAAVAQPAHASPRA